MGLDWRLQPTSVIVLNVRSVNGARWGSSRISSILPWMENSYAWIVLRSRFVSSIVWCARRYGSTMMRNTNVIIFNVSRMSVRCGFIRTVIQSWRMILASSNHTPRIRRVSTGVQNVVNRSGVVSSRTPSDFCPTLMSINCSGWWILLIINTYKSSRTPWILLRSTRRIRRAIINQRKIRTEHSWAMWSWSWIIVYYTIYPIRSSIEKHFYCKPSTTSYSLNWSYIYSTSKRSQYWSTPRNRWDLWIIWCSSWGSLVNGSWMKLSPPQTTRSR